MNDSLPLGGFSEKRSEPDVWEWKHLDRFRLEQSAVTTTVRRADLMWDDYLTFDVPHQCTESFYGLHPWIWGGVQVSTCCNLQHELTPHQISRIKTKHVILEPSSLTLFAKIQLVDRHVSERKRPQIAYFCAKQLMFWLLKCLKCVHTA